MQEARRSGWKRWLPNALTCVRVVVAAGLFVVLACWEGLGVSGGAREGALGVGRVVVWPLVWATVLFVVAAVTDALDGMLARRWGVVSQFGRIMDPFADKVLVLGTLIMMVGPNFQAGGVTDGGGMRHVAGFAPWMVVAMLARELLVTSIRAVMEGQGVKFSADWSGKIKMILQSTAIPAILMAIAMDPGGAGREGSGVRMAIVIAAWTTTVVTVASAWPYVVRAMRV